MKLINSAKRSYKGNLHAHTTASDGLRTPQQVMDLYQKAGYDFLAITDHWKIGSPGWNGNLLVLSGAEFDFRLEDQLLHVVGIFPEKGPEGEFQRQMDYRAVIRTILRSGGVAIAAHPAWSLNTPEFLRNLEGVCAAEVYNSFSGEPWNAPRADASAVLDLTAMAGRCLPQTAADDSHFYEGEQCHAYTVVQADALNAAQIVDALRRGAFYASQGPTFLDVELTDEALIVHSSSVVRCTFISNLAYTKGRCRSGSDMRENVYRLQPGEKFIRCEITDAEGRKAWLSPVEL